MARKRKLKYPGVEEAEKERAKRREVLDELPDFIAGAPNYDKFKDWAAEEVLAWLNVD